jgi:uncharacterized membrane protein
MGRRNPILRGLVLVYCFLWAGGVLSHTVIEVPARHTAWAGSFFMALTGVILMFLVPPRYRGALAVAGMLGYAAEVLGVHTGIPFGEYTYTRAFIPHLFGVPIVLAVCWAALAGYARELLTPHVRTPWAVALLGALLLTAFDLVLDPVAAGPMGLWVWAEAGAYYGVPFSNFAGWFVTSLAVMGITAYATQHQPIRAGVRTLGRSILLFFTLIALGHGLWAAAAFGVALLAGDGALAWRRYRARRPIRGQPPCGGPP